MHNLTFCFFRQQNDIENPDFYIVDNKRTILYISKNSIAKKEPDRYKSERVGIKVNYTFYDIHAVINYDDKAYRDEVLKEIGFTEDDYPEYFV